MKEQDVQQFARMMRQEWIDSVHEEGTLETAKAMAPMPVDPDGEPPCPACGTALPLVEGACSDCGLHLE